MADYLAIAERALKEYQARKQGQPLPAEDAGEAPAKPAKPPFAGFTGEGVARLENFMDKPAGVTAKTAKNPPPPWRLADVPPERQAEEMRRRLNTQGWVAILARRIGADAVVILCEDPARVPGVLARYWPVFTPREAVALYKAGGIEAVRAAYEEKQGMTHG